MSRIQLRSEDIGPGRSYHLLTALVVPRPIAWVTTRSAEGVDNIAAFSFSGVVSSDPPMVMFSTVGWKDSSRFAKETGEFCFHLAPANRITQINETAVDYPPSVDEFAAVGLTKEPAATVAPPRILESPAVMECKVVEILERGNGVMVIGEVVLFAVNESTVVDGRPKFDLLQPVGRLSGPEWALPGAVHSEPRIAYTPGMPGDTSSPAQGLR